MKQRKILLILLGVFALLCLGGCKDNSNTTGYPSGTVQFQTVYINGNLYVYDDEGWVSSISENYKLYGTVAEVNNDDFPTEELHATNLVVGQEVYVSDQNDKQLFVKYEDENGGITYGKYCIEEESKVRIR